MDFAFGMCAGAGLVTFAALVVAAVDRARTGTVHFERPEPLKEATRAH